MEDKAQALANSKDFLQTIIYLMGTSFILGGLVAILALIFLDSRRPKKP
jgi:hypothetical protein